MFNKYIKNFDAINYPMSKYGEMVNIGDFTLLQPFADLPVGEKIMGSLIINEKGLGSLWQENKPMVFFLVRMGEPIKRLDINNYKKDIVVCEKTCNGEVYYTYHYKDGNEFCYSRTRESVDDFIKDFPPFTIDFFEMNINAI